MQHLIIALLLDEGARGLVQALAGVAAVVVLVLLVAVSVPVAMLADAREAAAPGAANARAGLTALPSPPGVAASVFGARPPPAIESVELARRYLGVRYVFGGTDPASGLDCSGLVQLVFRQLGIVLPRTAQLQYLATARVPREQLQPGDLVFFARTYADPHDWITHVGIYVGGGQQINAPTDGQVVSIQPVFSGFWGAHYAAAGRAVRP